MASFTIAQSSWRGLYPDEIRQALRLVGYHDAENNATYEFLTNNFKLAPLTIAKSTRLAG